MQYIPISVSCCTVPVVPEKMAGEMGLVPGIRCGTVGFDYY